MGLDSGAELGTQSLSLDTIKDFPGGEGVPICVLMVE
jgi:hypothetical protein